MHTSAGNVEANCVKTGMSHRIVRIEDCLSERTRTTVVGVGYKKNAGKGRSRRYDDAQEQAGKSIGRLFEVKFSSLLDRNYLNGRLRSSYYVFQLETA